MKPRVLIAGCGYVGTALGELLREECSVWGLRRSPQKALPAAGMQVICTDLSSEISAATIPEAIDYAVFSISAEERTRESYERSYLHCFHNLASALRRSSPGLKRMLYVSSTSVYQQHCGEWVDEASPTEPSDFPGQVMLAAEHAALSAGFPATIVRFSGIYGPGRERMIQQVAAGTAGYDPGVCEYTNRIHREDCAAALRHLMFLAEPEAICLASDRQPCTRNELFTFLADALGVAAAPDKGAGPVKTAGKRCCSLRLQRSGFTFKYPSFREGYGALIAQRLRERDGQSAVVANNNRC